VSAAHPRGFASDNNSGAHPDVLAAIAAVNEGHVVAYGDDDHTTGVAQRFREHFGDAAEPFLVFNGTGANVAALDALTRPRDAVICTDVAHLHTDECGAPERLAGLKLLTVATEHGKLTPDDVRRWESHRGDEHRVQPRVVSITQASELGTVYTAEETSSIAAAAHDLGMYLHIDGARLANAAAGLGATLGEITTDAGADVISFGGTKNGLVLGEAVVFLRPNLADDFLFTRKQLGQLARRCATSPPSSTPSFATTCGGETPRRRTRWRTASPGRSPPSTASSSPIPSRRTASSQTFPTTRSTACATPSPRRCPSTCGTKERAPSG
jgi:threonine aldolase